MAYIQKIKTKKGAAHRVAWSLHGVKQKRCFPVHIPYASVRHFANTAEANKFTDELLLKFRDLILHFLRFTGLWVSEACSVRIRDINTTTSEIKLHNTKNGTEETIMLHRRLKRLIEK